MDTTQAAATAGNEHAPAEDSGGLGGFDDFGTAPNTGDTARKATIRLNDRSVFKRLIVKAFKGTGWSSQVWDDKTLWRDEGVCNTRTISIENMALSLPLTRSDIDMEVISSEDNRVRTSMNISDAYVTARISYTRRRTSGLCFWWSRLRNVDVSGRLISFNLDLNANLVVSSGKAALGTVHRIDARFGELDVDLDSTNLVEDWILAQIEDELDVDGWRETVEHFVNQVANRDKVKANLKKSINTALGQSLEVKRSASINGSTINATALLASLDTSPSPATVATFGYGLEVTGAALCGSFAELEREGVNGSPFISNSDIDLRIPRHAFGEAVYAYAKTGEFCKPFSLSGKALSVRPAGAITTTRGTTSDGGNSVLAVVPFDLVDNGVVTGTFVAELNLDVRLGGNGNLITTNVAPPQLKDITGSLSVGRFSVPLSSLSTTLQDQADAAWPTGSLRFRLLPEVLPLSSTGFQLELRSVTHQLRGWITVALDMTSGSSVVPESSGSSGGDGDVLPPPITLPELDIVPPEDADDHGDIGESPDETLPTTRPL